MLAGIAASALLAGLQSRGGAGWLLGFVFLVPWLIALDASRGLAGALAAACAMAIAFTAAVYGWFGGTIANYTQSSETAGLALLLLAAPLLQPQFLAFALANRAAARRHGTATAAFAGAAAWVAAEWLAARTFGPALGYTVGYGLYPSRLLSQAADLVGVSGLTCLLLLANQSLAAGLKRRRAGPRAMAAPLALAALTPLLLAAYGAVALSSLPKGKGVPLRLGMVQSNIIDYEKQRQEKGSHAVVREVLDTHFAMTRDAVSRQQVDAVLWSETVFPTTFGHPRSEAGAEFDREILRFVDATGVPVIFGTYDVDDSGEYNAAAFLEPGKGVAGYYRKANLFPLTEHVPGWLDGPALRRWLPWTGAWQPGDGARVFPLRVAGGRELPVLPMICLDDLDAGLAIDGARLGAEAILSMSNDSWFTGTPGMQMHLAAAAFRSIETRLPQFRVTPNGRSVVIDATGAELAGAPPGERALVVGNVRVTTPPRTLVVSLGNWVPAAAAAFLLMLAALGAWRIAYARLAPRPADATDNADIAMAFPARVAVLPPAARVLAGLLRAFARAGLLWMGVSFLAGGSFQENTLSQIRAFTGLFLIPELAAWCVLHAFGALASIEGGRLVLARGTQRMEVPLRDVVAVKPWRLPVPASGATLHLSSGRRWPYGLAVDDPAALARAVTSARGLPVETSAPNEAANAAYAAVRTAVRPILLGHPVLKFIVFPTLLAIPAFRLHQHIAYGSGIGEYTLFGLKAYLVAFSLWWAAWAIGVALSAAAVRTAIEAGTLLAVALRPARAAAIRCWLEHAGLGTLYIGLPAWLLLRIFGD
ncbi:apolipoprotein N-acyltransferase [Noviherbaspirillum sp. 17J57-3]|uniref:Apolipoprotein N-acyltransferase n=2 Tax=Noviherbaspirillum galbum TaxID=2709383 RepID=A0A6B3SP24_9BURK|nr:apolipoprotein N-acyltransferase [Noviherbaspirillum galbum]